jgi:integrase
MKKTRKKTTYGRVTVTQSGKYFRIRWRENKKTKEKTSTSYEKACSMAQEIDARLDAGKPGDPRMSMAALVAAATARTQYPNYSDEAWSNLRSLVRNHIVPKFENQRATSVTHDDLQNFLNGLLLGDHLSKFTVSKIRTILVRTGNYGMHLGIWTTTTNPTAGIHVLRSKPGDINDVQLQTVPLEDIPSEEEVRRLLDVAWEARPLHGFILEIAARSGLRWSEIMGLKPSDFDFENRILNVERARRELPDGTVIVKPAKTKAGNRMAIISKVSVKRVRAFVESQPANEFICRSASGGIVRKTHFVKPLNKYKAAANFPSHLTTHSLRHFFGTYGLRVGVKLVDMTRIIGHANPKTTLGLYVHGDPESVERSKAFL